MADYGVNLNTGSVGYGVNLSNQVPRKYLDTLKGGNAVQPPSGLAQSLTGDFDYSLPVKNPGTFGQVDLNRQGGAQNYNITTNSGDTGLFGLKDTTWGNIGTAGQLGLGLANTLTAMDQLNLQKEAFGFNKDMKNKEYAMAKDAYDRNVARAASIGEQMRKGQVS